MTSAESPVTDSERALFDKLRVPPPLFEAARVRHVSDAEARGLDFAWQGNLEGTVFPYLNPLSSGISTWRLRRDHPEVGKNGKPAAKYLSRLGVARELYFPPLSPELLSDATVPAVLVEAEKSALSVSAWAARLRRRVLPIGLGGCYGWLGKNGVADDQNGQPCEVKGPIRGFEWVKWERRTAMICLDANAEYNADVRAARRRLAEYLRSLGARVFVIPLPDEPGVNGPDDYLAAHQDSDFLHLCDKAQPYVETGLLTIRVSEAEQKAVEWLWPDRFPMGKLSLLVGDPGQGKSLLGLSVASAVSRGDLLPDGAKPAAGDVIILSAEDDLEDTIKPRLSALGADEDRIRSVTAVRKVNKEGKVTETYFDLKEDIWALEDELLRAERPTALIIVDPISAYMPSVDSHSNAETRSMLMPLAKLAEKYHVAVVAITHLRKSAGSPLQRIMGSIAMAAAARVVWAVTDDPDEPGRHLFLWVKGNLAPRKGGMAFRIVGANNVAKIEWETAGIVGMTAEDALAEREGPLERTQTNQAAAWLSDLLAAGPVATKEVRTAAHAAGVAWRTVERAKAKIQAEARREKPGDPHSGWVWVRKSAAVQSANQSAKPSGT